MKRKKIGRKCVAIILAFILSFPGVSGVVGEIKKVQATEVWIEITNKDGLKAIQSNLSANYRLMADIDLSGANWTPIGEFTGKLDGNSKVIRNFAITDTATVNRGLFSIIGAGGQVTNLGIEGVNITGGNYTGILAGSNAGTISRSYAKGSVSGNEHVGGLAGNNTGTINNSFASAFVSGKDYVGGLVGSNGGTVENCYSSSQLAASVFNNYLVFDGSTGYVEIPHHTSYATGSFTLEAWFQWDRDETYRSIPNGDVDFIIGKGVEQFEIHTGGGSGKNGIRFIPITQNGSADSYIDVKNVLQPGWFHVASVYDYNAATKKATARVFINGVAQELWRGSNSWGTAATLERETNLLAANTYPISIGRRSDGSYHFKGKISDVRFWNTARTAVQINADKNKQLAGTEPGLIGYWKLNEAVASGNVAIDSSATPNNGTLIGGVTRVKESAAANIGGLIGSNTKTVSKSYYDSTVSGQVDNTEKGVPKATAEIKNQATFTDWVFADIWAVDPLKNGGYPYLIPLAAVSFNSNGGSAAAAVTGVNYNASITAPTVPTKTGYTFGGWYKESGLTALWIFAPDINPDKVATDTTLYARWTANTDTAYKVEHYWQNTSGSGYTLHETVNKAGTTGDTATAAVKTYTGFAEDTANGSRIATGTIAADGNLALKLYYNRETFTVSFDSSEGSAVADITGVRYGVGITAPTVPTKTGYTFGGWYKEAALTNLFNFDTETITGATTIYAKWTAVSPPGGGDSGGTAPQQTNATIIFNGESTASGAGTTNIEDVNAVVSDGNNDTKTVSMNANEVLLLKQPDGTRSPLSDYFNVAISTISNSNVTISNNGAIQVQNLDRGSDYTFAVSYNLGGQDITIATMHINVASSGEVSISIDLIDPYGTITDAATGKTIGGANVTLYYADTIRNITAGKTPDTIVALPIIDGFKPNNNKNPQISDTNGSYGFMVFPNTDYYLVAAKDGYDKYTSPIIPVEKEIVKWNFRMSQPLIGVKRISGDSRVDTAISIAKATYTVKLSNVVLATSENYPDALAGSVLAYKLGAPILLVSDSAEDQEKVLSYIKENMDSKGTVYILGGTGVVKQDIETKIKNNGFQNINRLGGADRYETSVKITQEIGATAGTPIILVSAENYPDALSIGSIAAQYQYPMLLVEKDGITDSVKKEISIVNPGKIFIIGLQGAISTEVENQVLQTASIDKSNIIRIGGADRYETSIEIAKYFNLSGSIACGATGNDFPDALAGSLLAANYNAPIILCDKTLPDNIIAYLKSRKMSGIVIFGGEGPVSKEVEQQFLQMLSQ